MWTNLKLASSYDVYFKYFVPRHCGNPYNLAFVKKSPRNRDWFVASDMLHGGGRGL